MGFDSLCAGCFADLQGRNVCQACGWQEQHRCQNVLALPPRTVLKACYLVGRVLGQGGFGITYLALDLETARKLAIKEYLPSAFVSRSHVSKKVTPHSQEEGEYFRHGLAKFREEASLLATINHESIVAVHDCFDENGTSYLVMDYLGDMTLAKYLDGKGGRLKYESAFNVLVPVMDGLREIHSHGLIHRDVSPDNICLTPQRRVKLIDFGAARFAVAERHPKSLSVIVKDGYAPVEQYLSRGEQGPWTDIYALGATLYRTITGQLPPAALDRQRHDELVSPRRLGAKLPRRAEAALRRSMAVRPENRFQGIAEMQHALVSSFSHEPWNRRVFVYRCVLAIFCWTAAILLRAERPLVIVLGGLGCVFVLWASRLIRSGAGSTRDAA